MPMPHSTFGSPTSLGRTASSGSLLDRFHGRPVGEIRFPSAPAPARPAVNPDYLRKTRENDPWPEGSSCAPDSAQSAPSQPAVVISNCRFLTPPDQLRLHEPFDMAVDVRKTGTPKTRRAYFSLILSGTRDGKQESHAVWEGLEGFPDTDDAAHVVKATGRVVAMGGFGPGDDVTLKLVARHMDASESVESDPVQIVLRAVAHWTGGDAIHFSTDGEFPLLGSDGSLAAVLATAVERMGKPPAPDRLETVVCFGYANSAGDASHSRAISLRRAQAVRALLERDEKAWETIARENFGIAEAQSFLADLDASDPEGKWGCAPGAVDGKDGPKTRAATKAFQAGCNKRWKTGLAEDGVFGPSTWKAALRAIVGAVQSKLGQDPSKDPVWPSFRWGHGGKGVYANGEDFATGGDKPEERSVQITFFAQGSEPKLIDPPAREQASPQHNPVEDPDKIEKRRIGKPSPPPSTPQPKSKPTLQVGLFFDGTCNDRRQDIPKHCETNITKLYELFDADRITKYRFYYEGVGTWGLPETDALTGGLCGRGAQDRIERAFNDLTKILRDHPGVSLELSVFGFSRGAATALSFVNQLYANPSNIGLDVPPFDKIAFMGLFDTVGSFGVPGDYDEAGHDLSAHSSHIAKLVHLVAQHEKRSLFPLTSIKVPGTDSLPQGWEERVYPGSHSDIGGGYGDTLSEEEKRTYANDAQFRKEREENRASPNLTVHLTEKPNLDMLEAEAPRDGLSRIPCWVMYDLALANGVPLYGLDEIPDPPPPRSATEVEWQHVVPEKVESWIRFRIDETKDNAEGMDIPSRLKNCWKGRHHIGKDGIWISPSDESKWVDYYLHNSDYPWDQATESRKSKRRGVL